MAKKPTIKQYDDFGKGLNLFTRDTMIKENEAAAAVNTWSVGKNSIAKRSGIVKLCTIGGVSKIDGLGTFYNGATRELLAMAGGTLYKVQTGSPTTVTGKTYTSGLRTDFCQAGGKVYISNGTDAMSEYAGSTIADTTNGIIARFMIYYKGSLWAGGNDTYPTRLYRSGTDTKIGDFTYNVSTNPLATSVYVSKDDGQDLKGFFKHQDYLYPVKSRSLWRASQAADSAGTITLELVDPARGCDSHFSIDTVDNDNFMFNEVGVFATGYEPNILDQLRTNIVSLRIDPKIKAIQKDRLDDVVAIYHDNHYYLSYTSGGGGSNDTIMVYDRQRMGWWEFDMGANCFSEFKDANGYTRLYFGSSTDGSIYYFDETANNDDGVSYTTNWKSPKYAFGDYAQMKFFLYVLVYMGKMPGEPTINVYVDGELVSNDNYPVGNTGIAGMGISSIGTEMFGTGGGSLEVADIGGGDLIKVPINRLGRNVQVEITDNTLSKSWELNALEFNYKPLNPIYQPDTIG